jgi:octaprenyl-diphosphate synthase
LQAVSASQRHRGGRIGSGLDEVLARVEPELQRVNAIILDRLHSRVSLIPELARHIIAAGGKRIRPLLTLVSAKLCGYQGERQIRLAACVEFIHTATLLHDDVVDDSELRRGIATANAVWGNKASVLVGDFLFSRSFELMVEDGSLRVLEILANASAVIAEGEVAQLITSNDTGTTEADYLEVVKAKTAMLFAAACRLGAVLGGRSPEEEEAIASYGLNLGIAFQLVDDFLDYAAHAADMGKSAGDDFRDGKITLPVVLAFARGDDEERRFWRRTLEDGEQAPGDLEHAVKLLHRRGALADTLKRAAEFGEAARRGLDPFAASGEKRAMLSLVDFCLERAY